MILQKKAYRILIIDASRSGNINLLLNLISHKPDIDKTYLFATNPYEPKYQLLINKREITGLKHLNNSKAFIKYSNGMDDIHKNVEEYNPNKKHNILIVFDDMIVDMLSNKKLNPIVTQPYFAVAKNFD